MCMYKDKEDGHCTFRSCAAVTEYCVDGPCVDEVLTNADCIRAMNDEELAEFLCHFRSNDAEGHACSGCKAEPYCHSGHNDMIDWLQQPAEEDDNARFD